MPGPGGGFVGMSQGRGPVAPQTFYLPFRRAPRWVVTGATIDSTGAPLGNCTVDLFEAGTNIWRGFTLSDAGGSYMIDASPLTPYWLRFYKAGAPDVVGSTINGVLAVEA